MKLHVASSVPEISGREKPQPAVKQVLAFFAKTVIIGLEVQT